MQAYNTTDQTLHLLCQIIAKANRTYVPKAGDDSHTNLGFDSVGQKISGRWIKTNNDSLMVTLNLINLKIEILNSRLSPVISFETTGHRLADIEQAIHNDLSGLGLNPEGFLEPLHFEIPDYAFANDPFPSFTDQALNEWMEFRHLANEACYHLLDYAQKAGEVRIWPHHFDTGIYFEATSKIGVGFGLAMEDAMAGAPYFYMAGYALDGSTIGYEDLPQHANYRWEVGDLWNGALLPLSVLNNKTPSEQMDIVNTFITDNYQWFLRALD